MGNIYEYSSGSVRTQLALKQTELYRISSCSFVTHEALLLKNNFTKCTLCRKLFFTQVYILSFLAIRTLQLLDAHSLTSCVKEKDIAFFSKKFCKTPGLWRLSGRHLSIF